MTWHSDIRKRFSEDGSARRWSDLYDSDRPSPEEHVFRERRDFTVRYALETCAPEARIFDLGCGAGPVVSLLRQQGRQVVGLDYSPDMLRLARERMVTLGVPSDGLVQGDCERLPFRDGAFDLVICLGVISYVVDYSTVLAEIRRVITPGGRVVVSSRSIFNPLASDPAAPVKRLLRRLRHLGKGSPPVKIGRFLDPREVERKIRAAGFEIEHFTGMGFGPPRFHRRHLLPAHVSIGLSSMVQRAVQGAGAEWPYRWFADVNLWICRLASQQTSTDRPR